LQDGLPTRIAIVSERNLESWSLGDTDGKTVKSHGKQKLSHPFTKTVWPSVSNMAMAQE